MAERSEPVGSWDLAALLGQSPPEGAGPPPVPTGRPAPADEPRPDEPLPLPSHSQPSGGADTGAGDQAVPDSPAEPLPAAGGTGRRASRAAHGRPAEGWRYRAAAVLILALIAIPLVQAGRQHLSRGSAGGAGVRPGPGPTAITAPTMATGSPATGGSSVGPPLTADAEATALRALRELRDQDLATVTLDGAFAAQLASKVVGISDPAQIARNGTHIFLAADILDEHLRLRQDDNLGARVVLLLSTDYGRQQLYQGQPLWVTFALGPFGSAAAVQAWCTRRFPEVSGALLENHCTARRLRPIGG